MGLHLLLLVVGLLCIIKGGDLFVSSSVRLAELLRMPRVVIGSTLVSLATTTPEMTVSVLSGLRGESGLAVGNAVGSCICNLALILGAMAVVRQVVVHPRAVAQPFAVMAGCGLLVIGLSLDLELGQGEGVLLVGLGLACFAWDFMRHWRGAGVTARADSEAVAIEEAWTTPHPWLRGVAGTGALFAAGAVLVVAGSWLVVDAAVGLAVAFGVPTLVIGLTVVAFGTSLPELVTAITSARRDVSDLAVGNLLGANVANLTLITGSAAAVHPLTMTRLGQWVNFPALLGIMALAAVVALSGRRVTRREGYALLAYYAVYVAVLTALTVAGRR